MRLTDKHISQVRAREKEGRLCKFIELVTDCPTVGYKQIAEHLAIKYRSVTRYIRELENTNRIKIECGVFKKNVYHVVKKHKESIIMKKTYVAIGIALALAVFGCETAAVETNKASPFVFQKRKGSNTVAECKKEVQADYDYNIRHITRIKNISPSAYNNVLEESKRLMRKIRDIGLKEYEKLIN